MNESLVKYFSTLYDPIHYPIEVIEPDGKIFYLNEAFYLLWGYNLQELKEYSVFDDPELKKDGTAALIKEVFEKKSEATINNFIDSLLKARELTIPILKTKIFHLNIEKIDFVVLLHEDQTELLLTEEEIRKARDNSKEAERLKDTFLNVLSHELRTPLNIVLGYASIIKESMKEKITSEDKVYLDNLYTGSERLFNSITQMLEFAQIEAGTFKLHIENIDLIPVLKIGVGLIEKSAEEKNLIVKTIFNNDSIYVNADVHCVENAINNLLNNAVKFTRQGYIEIETSVLEDRELAVCKVKDSGIGISTEYIDHIFSPFSQEDLNISRHYEGNGLGLALAKKYLEKMGGSLLVDSIKGVGSTFTFTLPLSHKKQKPESGEQNILNKIFMLDDSSDSYELLKAFLKNDYEIESHNFRDFKFESIKEKDFVAIIFDVNQSHWEQSILICKDLKSNDPYNRPVIIISSEYSNEKIEKFYSAGASKFLVKPFSKSDLIKTLREAVN
ncbi:MAG: ATP-binding protein [Ignavibacteria bacterium]